jgi:hypothetical protein
LYVYYNLLQAYLEAREGSVPDDVTVTTLIAEVGIFQAVDNLYWGLWAVNQAKTEGCESFPYLLYAKNRLHRGLTDGGFL